MPKGTFFNLPDEKRERITEAAIDEFAEYSYEGASITRIVDNANIAKGSFYQYFEDKKDLFKHIIDIIGEKKLMYMTRLLKDFEKLDFFQAFREMYAAGIKFAKDNPRLSKIGNSLIKGADVKLMQEVLGEAIPKSNEFIKGMLLRGIQRGEIAPEIDADIVAYMLTELSISISEYFIKEMKAEDDMEILELADKMIFVIENGIKKR
ncbi:MAG: Transcriptional regulator, AcrR family [Firmicutes bacterium]|nr:Transcriptional regulator, AcrR family [Bacillota bacterium]MDI6707407.1 TetR/AcrR family transcriptional regulator [Bacillota bacterium]